MSMKVDRSLIAGYECRHVVHMPAKYAGETDYHYVKETIHLKDGRQIPNTRFIKDFKRPYWVTRKGCQDHKDKKEWEELEKLERFETTQSELIDRAAASLGKPYFKGKLKKLAEDPFLYGADILSTACVKRGYQDKYPNLITPSSIAAFDTETDVLNDAKEIIIGTLSFRNKVVCGIQKSFLKGLANPEEQLQKMSRKYLGDVFDERKIELEIVLCDSEAEIVVEVFKRAHEWQPDFIAIWNIDFDMPKMLTALQRAGIDPKDVFCDPQIPRNKRFFDYVTGQRQKKTASGKFTPIPPPMQWHTVFCPASFYFIDAMCAYKQIRMGEAEEPNYKLDTMLDKHLEKRKLTFEESGHLRGIDLHVFMQSNYPLEYAVYNMWDAISMEMLDEATHDLSLSLGMFSGCSDYTTFKSQPRRRVDDLHFFCLTKGHAIGTTSTDMTDEYDNLTLGADGWIITLPAHLVLDNGLKIISECKRTHTNIRVHVGDLDVSGSYPNGGAAFNVSKATTFRELHAIEGIEYDVQQAQGLNLSGGLSNASEFCTSMFDLPSMKSLVEQFKAEIGYKDAA